MHRSYRFESSSRNLSLSTLKCKHFVEIFALQTDVKFFVRFLNLPTNFCQNFPHHGVPILQHGAVLQSAKAEAHHRWSKAHRTSPHLNVTSPGTAPVTSSNLSITNDVTNHKHNDFMYTLSSACSASEVINLWPLVKVQVVTTSAQIPTKGHNKQSNSTCFKTV